METPRGISVAGTSVATSSGVCVQARKKKPRRAVEGNDRMIPDTRLLDRSARKVSNAIPPPPTMKLTIS